MRRKGILVLFLLSLVVCLGYMGVCLKEEYGTENISVEYCAEVMGIYVVEDVSFLQDMERLYALENPGVYFQDALVPYSKNDNCLYMSQNIQIEDWMGSFSVKEEGAFLCMLPDSNWENKAEAIRQGHVFTLWLVMPDSYYELGLVASGMPVISMNTQRMEEAEPVSYEEDPDKYVYDSEDLYYGSIRVFDCGVNGSNYEIVECNVRYHYKGATTANFDKKGYALSLRDAMGKKLDVPLLGMRGNSSWKLNSLVTDENRIREITAANLWEQFDEANVAVNEAGPKMEYVELLVDNDYKGLYCLVEPVDEEKLKLDGNDVLYKVIDWGAPALEDIQATIDNGWKVVYPIRIRYPEVITDYEAAWHPMKDYIGKMCYSQAGFERVAELVYPENACDMNLFLMTVSASDNSFKNMYYSGDVKGDGSYRLRQIPWDLDYTFGNAYDYFGERFTTFNPDVTVVYEELSTGMLLQFAPEMVEEHMVEKWMLYRQSFLSTAAITGQMCKNRDYLIASGVVERENARWPELTMSTNIDYLLEFQAARMEWLDEYFGGLLN